MNKIQKVKPQEVEVKNQSSTPTSMIEMALSKGADLEKLEKLLTLQERYESNEARKAYTKAMAAFKEDAPDVTKDKMNSQYNSKYTSLGNLINTVNPVLSKHGLSASWDVMQNGNIKVVCKLTHCLGHSEKAFMEADPDASGSKNKIQQIKSTITYLKAVTFESVCGLASTDANLDDDGNSAGVEYITDKEVNLIRDELISLGLEGKEDKFLKVLGVAKLEEMPKSVFPKAKAVLEAKRAGKKWK